MNEQSKIQTSSWAETVQPEASQSDAVSLCEALARNPETWAGRDSDNGAEIQQAVRFAQETSAKAGVAAANAGKLQTQDSDNPYGAFQERWEFPHSVTSVNAVTATTSHRETIICVPSEHLTVRLKEPYGDRLIVDPVVRRSYLPETPERLLSDDTLRQKYGSELTNEELAKFKAAHCHAKAQELLTLLTRARNVCNNAL